MKTMKPLIPLLLLLAVLVLTGAAAAEEENLIHPPESGVIVTGFTEIDSVQPDTAAAEAFMQSPVYNTVTDCLMQKNTPETLPEEILNLTLVDFPYRTADGEEMICSITVAELLNGMNTTFTGHVHRDLRRRSRMENRSHQCLELHPGHGAAERL